MANGDIGSKMAHKMITDLTKKISVKLDSPLSDGQCKDHHLLMEGLHKVLIGISVLLEEKKSNSFLKTKITCSTTTILALVYGIIEFFKKG